MNDSRRSASTAPAARGKASADMIAKAAPLWRTRDIAIVTLAILAVIAAAKIAAPLLVPVVLGLLGSYALKPVVFWLEKLHVPRLVGAFAVILALVGALGASAWWLADDVAAAAAELPNAARKFRAIVHQWQETGPGPISHMQEAATEVAKTAAEVTGQKPPAEAPRAAPPAPQATPAPNHLAENAALLIGLASQVAIALLLAGLMLAAGDAFRRKLVRIFGSSLARRRITVEILDEIDTQVQRQLMILVCCNVLIALLCWVTFHFGGLERAALWASVVGFLHFIPYAGTAIATLAVGTVALLQSGSLTHALAFAAATAAIAVAIGFLLMGWWQGRAVSMNAVATFVTLMFFGWLWGAWGLILGGSLMAIVKVCADRIESLKPLGEILGASDAPRHGTSGDAPSASR